jgi:glycosyltransferase involved in cell wall biosynthesis
LRILIVSQYFWPEHFAINEIAKTLVKKEHKVEVMTGKPNYPRGAIFDGYRSMGCQLEIHDGVAIHRIPLLARGRGGLRLALNYLSFVISGLIFSPRILFRRKFDVIFVYAPSPILQAIPAIFIGRLKGIPVVLWVQDLWPESLLATGHIKNKILLKLVEYVVRFIYRNVDLLLVQSNAFIAPVTALAANTPVKYFANSVDYIFTRSATLCLPDVDGLTDGFSVMFAGNIGSAQGVEVIIEAATLLQEYTDIHFVILGDGNRRDWLVQEVINRNLSNFHLPGQFPVETMPSFMHRASVLLVTLSNQQIFAATVPNKMQAYMAVGRPILASLNGEGARLVVESGAGLAVPAEDAKGLSEAVLKLYSMPEKDLETLGSNGRRYFKEHFDHNKLLDELVNHFQVVLQNQKELN